MIEQEQAYEEWAKKPSKENMSKLIKSYDRLINSEIRKYLGTLDKKILYNHAKKYVADAVNSYKPETGNQLSTHLVNNLQRLHRLNYRNVQGMRAPEVVQAKIRPYLEAKEYLSETLGRSPTEEEISKEIDFDVPTLKKFMKYEQGVQDLLHSNMQTETSAEEEMLDLIYHDAPDQWKKIIEYKTGYGGAKILSGKEIAKKLDMSPVRVSQISDKIGQQLMQGLYGSSLGKDASLIKDASLAKGIMLGTTVGLPYLWYTYSPTRNAANHASLFGGFDTAEYIKKDAIPEGIGFLSGAITGASLGRRISSNPWVQGTAMALGAAGLGSYFPAKFKRLLGLEKPPSKWKHFLRNLYEGG